MRRIGSLPHHIGLFVFDMDGTLYRQLPVRRRMAAELIADALVRRSTRTLGILRSYRRLRERLTEIMPDPFEAALVDATALETNAASSEVLSTVAEWMHRRPLRHVARSRYPGVERVFAAIQRRGGRIAILSDYPAVAKMEALGLTADLVVSADDPAVGVPKPNPRGLAHVIATMEATPATTLMIGDRIERDGLIAQLSGAHALIRSSRPIAGWDCFSGYRDPRFSALLEE